MRLRQILLNLLNNALKFTPCGGSVTLAIARDIGERLRITITDTGPGVPEALRPRLFQDYAQAVGDYSSGSSGLGLAISDRLARAMNGSLTYADGPDGGSRFTLVLPLPAAASPVVAPMSRASVPPKGLRILVVDDVSLNRMTARAMLEHAGHVVDDAAGGPAALAAIAAGPLPDIILMDQSMPGMDGYTTAKHIRAMAGPAGRLPILAVTANALPEDIEASRAAGMNGHVAKPIELKALLATIAGVLVPAEPPAMATK
jgi:CheY-like chemotaxis protein